MLRKCLIIPIEEVVREFDAKLFLALNAAARGFEVVIGRRDLVEEGLDQFPRGIFLGMDLRAPSTYQLARHLGHQVIAWDEEAVLHYPEPIYNVRRVIPTSLKSISALFAWGDDNQILWQNNPVISNNALIFKTGNPRGDMLRPEFRSLYQRVANGLKDRFGSYLLINTNFGSVNSINPELNIYNQDEDGELVSGKGAVGMPKNYARPLFEHRRKLYTAFQEMIPRLAQAFPEQTIIVRPHPMENRRAYESLEEQSSNVRVIHEGSVLPWILAARAVIHNGCNTGLEAYCLGTPALAYQPISHALYDTDLPNELSRRCADLGALVAGVAAALAGDTSAQTEDREALLDRYIESRRGRFAADKIAELLDGMSRTDHSGPGLVDRLLARHLFRQRLAAKSERKSDAVQETIAHRFPPMSADMVRAKLDIMQQISGGDLQVSVNEELPNLFTLSGRSSKRPAPPRIELRPQRPLSVEYPAAGMLRHPVRRWRMGKIFISPKDARSLRVVKHAAGTIFSAKNPKLSLTPKRWRRSEYFTRGPAHLIEVRHGCATGRGGVFDRRGFLLHGATHKFEVTGNYGRANRIDRLGDEILCVDDAVGVLSASSQQFFYHWMFDILPRWEILRQAGYAESIPLYINQTQSFQRATLNVLGMDAGRIIDSAVVPAVTAKRLLVPAFQIMSGSTFPDWVLAFLRDRFLPTAKAPAGGRRRLYLSRQGAAHRRVVNEPEILAALQPLGFENLVLEDLEFADQVAAFRDAEVVVGPHGGGLTHLVFCKPGTRVVELFPYSSIDLYYRLAHAAKLKYAFVNDREDAPPPQTEETKRLARKRAKSAKIWKRVKLSMGDFVIHPNDLRETLRMAGVS